MIPSVFSRRERSFQNDPRMRQALSRLSRNNRDISSQGPVGTSLYWLLRSRRPKFAALVGGFSQADTLVIACAMADCGAKLVAESRARGATRSALSAAGLDWILRSGECLGCLHRLRPLDCLIVGDTDEPLSTWREQLDHEALILGIGRRASCVDSLARKIRSEGLAEDVSRLRDGRDCLLIADHEPG